MERFVRTIHYSEVCRSAQEKEKKGTARRICIYMKLQLIKYEKAALPGGPE